MVYHMVVSSANFSAFAVKRTPATEAQALELASEHHGTQNTTLLIVTSAFLSWCSS